jgi:hypothetical protein
MKTTFATACLIGLTIGSAGSAAHAATITILDIGDSGTASDGTRFVADANPTSPSTGTGVFEPFVRLGGGNSLSQGDGLQVAFNTDAKDPAINFDTKGGIWTRSVLFSELSPVNGYYVLSLDANQSGKATSAENRITITNMEIFIAPGLANPESAGGTGYSGHLFDGSSAGDTLLGNAPVWSLDSAANGNVDILLQASICDSKGQCGSGHGDLDVLIPAALLAGNPNANFVLYTEYGGCVAGGDTPCAAPNSGFEEWRIGSVTAVPGPAALLPFLSALAGVGPWLRRRAIR